MPLLTLGQSFSLIDLTKMNSFKQFLQEETTILQEAHVSYQNRSYDFMHLPFDLKEQEHIKALAEKKTSLKPSLLVVIGIGGSLLGTVALYQILQEQGLTKNSPAFAYADSLDIFRINLLCQQIKSHLEKKEVVLCIVISKSGTTTETIANAQVILTLLAQYAPQEYKNWVTFITDHNSPLWQLAVENNFTKLLIPQQVGGRFSVFSSVGLFPLALLGVDIDMLCKGAQEAVRDLQGSNVALQLALFVFGHYYYYNLILYDSFFFSLGLEGVGKWFRQLVGESLGKKNKQGTEIILVPTISLGTVDLHSMVQTYLGAKRSFITSFILFKEHNSPAFTLPDYSFFNKCAPYLQAKSFSVIMDAIIKGVQESYRVNERPFISLELTDSSPRSLGFFLQTKMIEVCYLATLFGVNPFDQPNVEDYKKETKRILARGQ